LGIGRGGRNLKGYTKGPVKKKNQGVLRSGLPTPMGEMRRNTWTVTLGLARRRGQL